MASEIKVLDHGYVRFIEAWGHGDTGCDTESGDDDYECGIIEAARQSTQGAFRGWEPGVCNACGGFGVYNPNHPMYRHDLETYMGPLPQQCSICGGKGKHPGDKNLLAYLHTNKHATPFEFSGMVIEVKAPIAVFREWHRHRTQSYNEMSARYDPLPDCNYMPTPDRCLMVGGKNRQAGAAAGSDQVTHKRALEWLGLLDWVYRECEVAYQSGLKAGIPKELARLCLPVGRYSQMRASTCLRNWLAFLTLRMDPQAQWEIRQYANVVGQLIAEHFPRTWALFCARTVGA